MEADGKIVLGMMVMMGIVGTFAGLLYCGML